MLVRNGRHAIRSASATLPYEISIPILDRSLQRPMTCPAPHRPRPSPASFVRPVRLVVLLSSPFEPSLDLNGSRPSGIRPGRPLIHPRTHQYLSHHCAHALSPWMGMLPFRLSSPLVLRQDVIHFPSPLSSGSHAPPCSQPSDSHPETCIAFSFNTPSQPPFESILANLSVGNGPRR